MSCRAPSLAPALSAPSPVERKRSSTRNRPDRSRPSRRSRTLKKDAAMSRQLPSPLELSRLGGHLCRSRRARPRPGAQRSEKSRHPARGMPPQLSLSRSRPAFRVTGATPSGRPGPRAPTATSHQPARPPSGKTAGLCGARPASPSRATQASAPLKLGRAARAAGAPAARPAGQPPPSARRLKPVRPSRKTPRCRGSFHPRSSCHDMAASFRRAAA
jgi:hypothetical protein